jgi:polar amino acid transport system substrate-binding protein
VAGEAPKIFSADVLKSALFLPQYSLDPSGKMQGHGTGYIGLAMTRLIASRLGVKSEVLGLPSPPAVMDALLAGDIDMAFFGIEPGRQAKADFTPPMFQFDYTYLVPAGSPITQIADADKTGTRIAIMDSHASALALKLIIKHATIVSAELPEQSFELLRSREADVFASPRDVLLDFAEKLPGSRVLADAFGVNRVGIAIRKGREALLTYLSSIVEAAKADSTIARLIEEGRLRGFSVAD